VCVLVIAKHQALKVHGLAVVAVGAGLSDQQAVGIVGYLLNLEHSQWSQPRAIVGPELVEISRPQLGLAHFSSLPIPAASEVLVEVFVIADSVRLEAARKVFAVVVETSPVVYQPPPSPSPSSQILHPLQTWTVLPIAVDSFRRRQSIVEESVVNTGYLSFCVSCPS
jgi:hypothetical protein